MFTQILLSVLLQAAPLEVPAETLSEIQQIERAFALAAETKSRPSILCLEPKFRKAIELNRSLAATGVTAERRAQIEQDLISLARSAGKCPMPTLQAKN